VLIIKEKWGYFWDSDERRGAEAQRCEELSPPVQLAGAAYLD